MLSSSAQVPLAWKTRAFDTNSIYRDVRPHGETILQMVKSCPDLPDRFWTHGVVCINGDEVSRDLWHVIRPKASDPARPIIVTMHMPMAGGGGGGKAGSILGIIAALALTVLTAGIGSGALLGATSAAIGAAVGLSAGAGASILAGVVGIAGALAISALTAPPAVKENNKASVTDDAKESASADGNVIEPGGAIPRVIGTRKVFPALACEPLTELVDDDEYVEALYILNGPHLLTDIKMGDTAIIDADDVEYQTREGWTDDTLQTLVTRQGRTVSPQLEMSTHAVDSENPDALKNQGNPAASLPVWHSTATRNAPDEVWLHFLLPQGISLNGSTTNDQSIPIRIRLRKRGDVTWINLPEVHISDRTLSQKRRAVILKFGTNLAPKTNVPSRAGFVAAYNSVPAQTIAPAAAGWTADASFNNGGGGGPLYRGTEGTTSLKQIYLYSNRAEIWLDPAVFPPGIYDIQVKRGMTFDTSTLVKSTYTYAGAIYSFFDYYTNGTGLQSIKVARENLAEQLYLNRVISVWNDIPITEAGLATIAIKARNRRVEALSTVASGYVKDWNGSSWSNWITTSNPAPHYVDILSGALNLDPLPIDIRDDTGLVAWRTLAASKNWTVDLIIDDYRTQDALQLVASCGYARPYQSEIYGVTVDKDVSADAPMQVFSPRNSTGFRWEKAFAKVPDGFILTYRDAAADYNDNQIIVFRTGYGGGPGGIYETVTYDGLVNIDKVRARALFDLDQASLRSTFYYLDTDGEAILCRRGDLVAVAHDVILKRSSSARVKRKILSGGNIVSLLLDGTIPVVNNVDMHGVANMHAVTDMHLVGQQTGIAIRRTDGTISTHAIKDAEGEKALITLTTPIADTAVIEGFDDTNNESGCLIVSGDIGSEYKRLLVSGITPNADLTFSLTLVDEAPSLVRGT